MDNNKKKKIIELRKSGFGYKKIAKELSLTVSAVRCVCEKITDEYDLIGSCKNCGIKIKSIKGKRKKVFCSDKCRMAWWNSHIKEVNKKAYYSVVCKCCSKEFIAYGNNKRVYCSHSCYINDKAKKDVAKNG